MTLKEALESKKPFKRPLYDGWTLPETAEWTTFSSAEVLADDWQVKTDPLVISAYIHESAIKGFGEIEHSKLYGLVGQKCRVTIEVLP